MLIGYKLSTSITSDRVVLPSASHASILALSSTSGMQSSNLRLRISAHTSLLVQWHRRHVVERIKLLRQEHRSNGSTVDNHSGDRQYHRIFHHCSLAGAFSSDLPYRLTATGLQISNPVPRCSGFRLTEEFIRNFPLILEKNCRPHVLDLLSK